MKNRKPRRLSLNCETIRVLNDPALLELARGGVAPVVDVFGGSVSPNGCCPTGSDTHQGG
jgi:hypothetical protein